MRSSFILGVTGVIGSGKSTLCKFLQEQCGFHWISTDAVVHDLYKISQPGYKKIQEYFGKQFVGEKEVHRGRLRRLVLHKPEKLWILNKLVHPLVLHEVNKKIVQLRRLEKEKKREKPEKALLKICLEAVYFEPTDLGKYIDALIVVEAKTELIMKRLEARKIQQKDLLTLIKFQRRHLPQKGIALRNDGSLEEFIHRGIQQMETVYPRPDRPLHGGNLDSIDSSLN